MHSVSPPAASRRLAVFFLTSCRQPRRSGARPWHTVFQKGALASKFFVRRLRLSRIPAGPSAGLLKRIAARAKACRRVSIAGARGPNVARTKARDRALPRRDEKLIYRVGRSIGRSELGRAHRHFVLAGCDSGWPYLPSAGGGAAWLVPPGTGSAHIRLQY